VDEIMSRFLVGPERLGELERTADVRVGSEPVDNGLHAEARVNGVGIGAAEAGGLGGLRRGGGHGGRGATSSKGRKKRGGGQQFKERSPVIQALLILQFDFHISSLLPLTSGPQVGHCYATNSPSQCQRYGGPLPALTDAVDGGSSGAKAALARGRLIIAHPSLSLSLKTLHSRVP